MKYQYAVNPEFNGMKALETWKQLDAAKLESFLNAAGEQGFEFFTVTGIGDPDAPGDENFRIPVTTCIIFRKITSMTVEVV